MRISDWSSDVCSSDLARERTARAANVGGSLHAARGEAAAGFVQDVVDHAADLVADQLGNEALFLDTRIAIAHRLPAAADQRHGEELVEGDKAGAQAVVYVVIVVGDKIGRATWRERVCQYV